MNQKENKNKYKNIRLVIEEQNFDPYFNDLYKFCEKANNESTLEKTINNMKASNWFMYPESLLYRIYKSKKYNNGKGLLCLLYNGEDICACSGIEKYTDNIAIMAKRLYVYREFRNQSILSTYFLKPQITWAKKHNFKCCLITVNEYQKHTVLAIFKRAQKNKGIVLGKDCYPDKNLFSQMNLLPNKLFINGEKQYIMVYKLNKNYSMKELKNEIRR